MPFLMRDREGREVLFFCRKNDSGVWKVHYSVDGGEPFRMMTGMPDEATECSPTAWQDDNGWHISFVAGRDPLPYQLYLMHGTALETDPDSIWTRTVLSAAKSGFAARGFSVTTEVVERLTVKTPSGVRHLLIPDSYIYAVTYRSDKPEILLISTGSMTETGKLTVFEYDTETGRQFILEADGLPVYKGTIFENKVLYTRQTGETFEEREIVETGEDALTRLPTNRIQTVRSGGRSSGPCSDCSQKNEFPPTDNPTDNRAARPSCLECVEKHLGAAMVLCSEVRDGYPYRLLVIGHLHEAEDESQEYDVLHDAIRQARKAYQKDGTIPDWTLLAKNMEEIQTAIFMSGTTGKE
jgi:hypothetical protein